MIKKKLNLIIFCIFLCEACSSGKPLSNNTESSIAKRQLSIPVKNSLINLNEYNFPQELKSKKQIQNDTDEDEEELFEKDLAIVFAEFKTENEEMFFNLGKKALPPEKFVLPIKNKYSITSNFGMRFHPLKKKNLFHKGIDIKIPIKTKVFASADGRVIMSKNTKAYGNVVIIAHSRGISSLYAHNDLNSVQSGMAVKKGQMIALSGNSGHSTGPHLHFEIRKNNTPIDPLKFLKSPKDY